ncbi:MAG: PqqD family protein [Candidatus Omnitrophica bacterium]|nr:PqqD family protein [Candidatus Omnitrophota bacterium]
MKVKAEPENVYKPAEDNVVAREIQGEFILVPIVSGIGDMEDEIFSLNETGKAVWSKLDGKQSLKDIAKALALDYDGPDGVIEDDGVGIAQELLKRKMLVEVKRK